MTTSDLEAAFDTLWLQLGGQPLTAEYEFDPARQWRFDRCHIVARVGIEIDGGTWGVRDKNGKLRPGRHTSGKGYRDDCIKLNTAAARGWLIFRLTSDMLRDDPATHLGMIRDKIEDVLT